MARSAVRASSGLRLVSAVAMVVIAVFALSGCRAASASAGTDPATSAAALSATSTQVAVIGDSLSTGIDTPGTPWTDRAQALMDSAGLDAYLRNASENGAGYVATGSDGHVFADLVRQVVNRDRRVVLLFGSDNDTGQPDLASTVAATVGQIRALAPSATIVLVGPPLMPADAAEDLTPITDALRATAAQSGTRFADPVSLKWFQGDAAAFVGPDGEHPNQAGEEYLAVQMVAILKAILASS